MNTIRIIITLFFLTIAVFSDAQPTRQDAGLKGPVHTVETKQIALSEKLKSWFSGPKVTVDLMPIVNPVSSSITEGVLFHRHWLEYHPTGVLMEDSHYHGSDAVDQRIFYHLNQDARCEQTEFIQANSALNHRQIFQLGPHGYPVRREDRNSQDQITSLFDFVFDDQGRKREETQLTPEGAVQKKWIYQYNDQGVLESINQYGADGKQQVKRNYIYGDTGRLLSEQILDDKNALSGSWDYTSDVAGNRIEESMNSSKGGLESHRIFTYDDRGNVTTLTKYGRGGDLSLRESYRYQYDEQGNWIVKSTYSVVLVWNQPQRHPKQVDFRSIVYYP